MTTLLQDLRFAIRSLRRTPAFPLAAIATLALGIGATTAIFSTVNAVLLQPLPYPDAHDLYALRTTLTDGRVTTGRLAPSEIVRLNDPTLSIERAVGVLPQEVTLLRDDGTPIRTQVYGVSEGFFELFGLPMAVGPGFTPEQSAANGPPVTVISYRLWQDMYGGDPAVVGKPVRFAEATLTIAGVAPQGFDMPRGADFWFNLRLDPQGVNHSFDGYMRLRPGTDLARAESEMASVMAGVARDYPASARARVYVVDSLVESIVGDLGPILIIVLSATGLLLVLACVNVTNLLLARGAARSREMAVRVALGAGRRRIVRQLLTESVLLASAGGVLGLAVAYGGVQALMALGASRLPRLDAVAFDGRVLLFALTALVVSGLFVGFAPALRLAGTDVKTLMNESGRSGSAGRGTSRWLGAMTVAEIALAITLVAGAGWLIRGFANLRTTDPGFVADRRLAFDIALQGPRYRDGAAIQAATAELLQRLRGVSGVGGVGATFNLPLRGGPENSLFVQFEGETMDPNNSLNSRQRIVSPGFFDAMGTRIVSGRDFGADDRLDTPAVAVVNRAFVRRYMPGKEPIGARFAAGYPIINPQNTVTIVGVVDDVRQRSLSVEPEPAFYTSTTQQPSRRLTLVVEAAQADPASVQTAVRDEIRRFDSLMAVDAESVEELVASTLRRQELGMTLMLLFGAAAVALAAVGIYGVVAYAASQRRGEMATRLALGATPRRVFWLVVKQGSIVAAAGTGIGLVLAYLAGRVVSSRVYEVRAADPLILGGATVLVVTIVLVATTIPAFRASRLDPAGVLRPD